MQQHQWRRIGIAQFDQMQPATVDLDEAAGRRMLPFDVPRANLRQHDQRGDKHRDGRETIKGETHGTASHQRHSNWPERPPDKLRQ